MDDLFEHPPTTAQEPRGTSSKSARGSRRDYTHPREPRKGEDPREFLADTRGATSCSRGGSSPSPAAKTLARSKNETRRELAAVYEELVPWRDAVRRAQSLLDPYENAFRAAHEHCALVVSQRRLGVGDTLVKYTYDRRMLAGHAAHPFRQKLKEAERMVKALTDIARELNEELEQ